MTVRLDGKPVAEATDRRTRDAIRDRPGAPTPTLASVHRDVDSPFRFYVRRQRSAAESLGIAFREVSLGPDDPPAALRDRMRSLDDDPSVHAVLLEHPLPDPLDFFAAISSVRPEKDVDGVGAANLGRLVAQRPTHIPAVARAAVAIAQHYRLPIEGVPVTVVGRSETVGLPLALCLAARRTGMNATVTLAHSRTTDLARALAGATTIFSCVGRPGFLDRSVVPEGAAVIDVGLSSVPDPAARGGSRAVGDADAVSLDGWAGALTPVPGGVGPVTVAELMSATVRARDLQAATGGSS